MSVQENSLNAAENAERLAEREIARRRTFAIISHPDAGKTTLTEKFLLYGGALQLAGSVTARKNQRATASDWMELERQRGISVSSTVLQFEYGGCVVNLLDTPGHKDFSEDTYRVLTAVDAAVMVVDAAKGIEAQTRKLFEVCRKRGVPIFTFMNKLDRPAKPPLDLLDELEGVLGIQATPMNWPLGNGEDFRGVYDRQTREVHLFERTPHGAYRAPVQVGGTDDPLVRQTMSAESYAHLREELDILEAAGAAFDNDQVRSGRLTPVFFGSAMNNFGVPLLLDRFLSLAPAPTPRAGRNGPVSPQAPSFSGFIFKIQANMNPRHRDRVAFVRIVSGEFRRDMTVEHPRTGKPLRLSNSQRLFARERETLDRAWAGDVVGIVGNQDFEIGDTVTKDPSVRFDEIPRFAPECFAHIYGSNSATHKRFREGLDQLLREGVAQAFKLKDPLVRIPLLGAVGPLQFDVLQYRLESEYGAECRIQSTPWTLARWIRFRTGSAGTPDLTLPTGAAQAKDAYGFTVALLSSAWALRSLEDNNPGIEISAVPFPVAKSAADLRQ
jgi:peptide chain release factor 3